MVKVAKGWKETVRAALSKAQDEGVSLAALAEIAGTTGRNLNHFVSRGTLNADSVRALEDWLKMRNYLPSEAHEEPAPYGVTMQTCPACGESTPMEIDGIRLVHCGHCGEPLGRPCPKCSTLETRDDAQFCRACGFPLTQDAAEARAIIQEAEAPPVKRALRDSEKHIQRKRQQRKRGEPEL